MKRMIVNADDFGADPCRNTGIARVLAAGVATSASILANGAAFAHMRLCMAELAQRPISWGLHLNLSEGRPISSGLRYLTGPDGAFPGKAATAELLGRQGGPDLEEEIYREATAQLTVLTEAGIQVRHLDGHQHIHVFPAVAPVTVRLARTFAIPWVRIPEEPQPAIPNPGLSALDTEAARFSALAGEARSLFPDTIRTADAFRGLYLKDRVNPRRLARLIEDLPDGLTELMVHPGEEPDTTSHLERNMETNPFAAFGTVHRGEELHALLSPAFRQALKASGVSLVPFPEAP